MKWAQVFLLVWFAVLLLMQAHDHGKVETKTCNFWTTLLIVGFWYFLIYVAGGFNKVF